MSASVLYRIASVMLLLFAASHTLGFWQPPDPKWGVDAVVGPMRSVHFDVLGSTRTYWDFFLAAGFSVGMLYLFAAILAWQLGGLPITTLAMLRGTVWAFAASFAVIAMLSWRYLFVIPVVFSIAITIVLVAAAWLSAKPTAA